MSDRKDLAERIAIVGVSAVLIGEIFKLLIEKGVLREGEAVDRLERLAADLMSTPTGKSAPEAVSIIQAVRDYVADEIGRKPS
jgi:hypothetical protein